MSTVVDVVLFLLLLSGAVATLVGGLPGPKPDTGEQADAAARVLATSTATVEYEVSTAADRGDLAGAQERRAEAAATRRTHGTVLGLLASAAVADARIDGRPTVAGGSAYRRAVADAVRNATGGRDLVVNVTARWRPYPDAPLRGRVAVGPAPPATVDRHAARLTPASGLRYRASSGDTSSLDGLATRLAGSYVHAYLAPNATRVARRGDYPADVLVETRYRQFERALGVSTTSPRAPSARTDRIVTALATRFETDLRRQYETPAAARRAVSVGRVTVVVRTWSP